MTQEINLKIFPEPNQEAVESYLNHKRYFWILTGWLSASITSFALFIFSLIAIIIVKNFSLFNIMVVLVLISLTTILASKLILSFDKEVELVKGVIREVRNITTTYESINPQQKGEKTKLEIHYEFKDSKGKQEKTYFSILFDKEKFEDLKSEIPDSGNEIPVIYNHKKTKVMDIYIPALKPYIESY